MRRGLNATPDRSSSDIATVAAIGALCYIVADVVHEAIGHGGACLATGGRIILLTSVFFRSDPGSRLVDAAGPGANLVAGLFLLGLSKRARPGATGFFLLLAAAFNLFWCAGYFLYSGASNQGDWALVIRDWPPPILWRTILFLLGLVLYTFSIRQTIRGLARLGDQPGTRANTTRLFFIPYFAAGLTACAVALFDRFQTGEALVGAFREAFLANVVLSMMPRWLSRTSNIAPLISRQPRWIVAAVIALVLFSLTMGRGYRL